MLKPPKNPLGELLEITVSFLLIVGLAYGYDHYNEWQAQPEREEVERLLAKYGADVDLDTLKVDPKELDRLLKKYGY
jgi:hypothetical protein